MIPFLVASVVTGATVALLLPLLRRRQVMDVPNARSSHAVPVPRGGGVGVVAGVFAAVLVATLSGMPIPWTVVAVVLAMACVGFVDDLVGLSSKVRFAAQVVAGLVVAAWLVVDSPAARWPAIAFIAVVVVGFAAFVNAFNFMDGINGISALTGVVAGGWFAWVGHDLDLTVLTVLGASTAGACLGFLPWNAPQARVFLGDTGSYALGALIVSLALYAWAQGAEILTCCAPLLVYLADTAWALVQRARRGEALAEAHRGHVYQRLVDSGWSHLPTAAVVAAAAAAVCGLASLSTGGVLPWVGVSLVLLAYLALTKLLDRSRPVRVVTR